MPVTHIEHTIVINRPVSEVFAYLSKPENMPKWAKATLDAAQTSEGPVGVGTTCYVVNKAMGMQVNMDFVVTEFEQDSVYAAKTTKSLFPMELTYKFESVDGGTRVHVTSEADLAGVMSMAGPLLKRKGESQIKDDHANLKRILESGSSGV